MKSENVYDFYGEYVQFAINDIRNRKGYRPVLLDSDSAEKDFLGNITDNCGKVINLSSTSEEKANLANLQMRDDSVDIIAITELLKDIQEPRKVAKELTRVLKRGGFIAFVAVNRNSFTARFDLAFVELLHRWAHRVFYLNSKSYTPQAYYRMNSFKDIDSLLGNSFERVKFVYCHDNDTSKLKYYVKPFAKLWNWFMMKERFRENRTNIVGLYRKNGK